MNCLLIYVSVSIPCYIQLGKKNYKNKKIGLKTKNNNYRIHISLRVDLPCSFMEGFGIQYVCLWVRWFDAKVKVNTLWVRWFNFNFKFCFLFLLFGLFIIGFKMLLVHLNILNIRVFVLQGINFFI